MDLGTADVLEEQLKFLISSVDELNQVRQQPVYLFNPDFRYVPKRGVKVENENWTDDLNS